MKKSLNYSKSFATPGMASTNIAGFQSKTMCPQGITFAKSYCLITAYDRAAVENSVIYVLSKNGKKLLTTIALPNKTHAGGIAFDGTNVWITQGYTVRSIPFSTIQSAAKQKKEWAEITAFKSIVTLTHQAATLTYYKKNSGWHLIMNCKKVILVLIRSPERQVLIRDCQGQHLQECRQEYRELPLHHQAR